MNFIILMIVLLFVLGLVIQVMAIPTVWSISLSLVAIYIALSYWKKCESERFVPKEYVEAYESAEKLTKQSENKANEIIQKAEEKISNMELILNDLKKEKEELEFYISENRDDVLQLQIHTKFDEDITSSEIKNKISLHKLKEKELFTTKGLLKDYSSSKHTQTKAKQLLRAFNSETDYYISNVTTRKVNSYRDRVIKTFEQLNKLFEKENVQITKQMLESKLEYLELIYQYQVMLENEKEILQAQKEEIKEQQRVEKELQDAKKRIEKEFNQFNNELNKMLKYLNSASDDISRKIYADKITELETKITSLEKDREDVLNREQNTRAGFVYIISNIGSFGENVYKIGMTRRLEPMDRIKELSNASVPFPFDVHALIFSSDAPTLENKLHHHFKQNEVNKINSRKEFFKVDLEEIKKVVHEEFDKSANFIDFAAAEQYRESIKIEHLD